MMKGSRKNTALPADQNLELMEELEARILLSDGIEAVLLDPAVLEAASTPVMEASLEPGVADAAAALVRQELVIVDTATQDYQKIIDDITANTDADRQLDVVTIDSSKNGIEQISEILSGYDNLDAVHIISHATDGQIFLGTSPLMVNTLFEYSEEISLWSNAFSEEADLLFYGCDLAASENGEALIQGLSNLTGADVAASDDSTGDANLGADWDLEYQTGEIETEVAVSVSLQASWSYQLATLTYIDDFSGATSTDVAGTTGSDGTQDWSGNVWETSAGQVRVVDDTAGTTGATNNSIRFTRAGDGDDPEGNYWRDADTSAATGAITLTINYRTETTEAPDTFRIYASSNGGSSWTQVGTVAGGSNSTTYGTYAMDITAYKSSNMSVRFDSIDYGSQGPDRMYIDYVKISYVTASNSAPVVSNIDTNTLAYTEGDGAAIIDQGTVAGVVDSDSTDFDTGTLTVSFASGSTSGEDVLAIQNQGTGAGQIGVSGSNVTYAGNVIGTYTGGSSGADLVITFNSTTYSTPTAAAELINAITYENTNTDNPDTTARTIDFVLTDGDGGTSNTSTATINVTAVNDAPINTLQSAAESVDEDTALTFSSGNSNLISISDVDIAGDAQVTLGVGNGTLTLSGTAGLSFTTGDGTSDTDMVFTGTVAAINTALSGMTYTGTSNWNGSETLTITTSDQGGTGSGGTKTDVDTVAITVNAVNDAPVNTLQSTAESVDEDTALTFSSGNSNLISISDTDISGDAQVTLGVGNGVLSLSGTTGLTFTTGDGTSDTDMVFTGTVAAINTALSGMTYTGSSNWNGSETLTITTSDQGGTGSGGTKTDTDTVTI